MTGLRVRAARWRGALLAGAVVAAPIMAAPLRIVDDTAARVPLTGPAARVVSLSPGTTEMLFAIGAGAKIVATVRDPDADPAVRKIERIGDANALNWERLLANRPDVVVAWENLTNTLVIESLRKLKLPVYFVRAKRLADIPASMRRLGVLVGTAAAADAAASDAEKRLAALSRHKSDQAPLKVFYMIWDQPLYTIGGRHIINDAIQHCGAVNIFSDIDFPAPVAEIEAIVKRNPDVIIMSAPPITARDWRERWQRFTTISAVANQQILRYNDPRLDRMGPSAIDAVDGLCKLLAGARSPRA